MLLLLLLAGCGGEDDEGGSGGYGGRTDTTSGATTGTTETTESKPATTKPEAGGDPPDKAELTACLAKADLVLKQGDEPFKDSKGQTKTRKDMNLEDATYLGYVQWPSKSVADIYTSKDEAAAEKAEREAGLFVKAFGLDPGDYVRRAGAVLMTFDDPPPSDQEAKQVEDCAAS